MSQFSRQHFTEITNPNWYYCIGRLMVMDEQCTAAFDRNEGEAFGEVSISLLLRIIPDGIIFQRWQDCYISQGQQLIPFDPRRTDWTNRANLTPPPALTPKDFAIICKEAARDFVAHQRLKL